MGAIPSPRYTYSDNCGSRMRLSLAANRDLQAKGSAISGVNPVAILVSDPSAKDELITRCRFFSILHNSVLLF